jgi:flagellar basal-body rod protein FlgB
MATNPLLPALAGFLKVVDERQQLVVTNMANADTPGYHTRDLDFQSAMQQVMDSDGGVRLEPATLEMTGLPERPDGNNVNIDREGLLLSQLQLQYRMGVQLVKEQFQETLAAIKEQ